MKDSDKKAPTVPVTCPNCSKNDVPCPSCNAESKRSMSKGKAESLELLKAVTAVLDDKKQDLKKNDKAEKVETEKAMEKDDDTVEKALSSILASSLSRRARMDVAFKLGEAAGNVQSTGFVTEPAVVTTLDIGTTRTRPMHEPPVVPIRHVDAPAAVTKADNMADCSGCGYVYKSTNCPRCEQAHSSPGEAGPLWRR